jgi:hypothetical protein
MLIKARSNEAPYLKKNNGAAQQNTAYECEL